MVDLTKEARMLSELAEIRERFLRRARGEVHIFLDLLATIGAGDSTRLVELQFIAHRLHGGGATFDFPAISKSAGHLHNLLEALMGAAPASVVEPQDLHRLVESGRRLAAEIGAATAPPLLTEPTQSEVPGVANK
jgi:chemotaxis protein histidine kinase CheA